MKNGLGGTESFSALLMFCQYPFKFQLTYLHFEIYISIVSQ